MKEFVFTMLAVFVVLSGGVWAQASELAQIVFHSNRDLHNNIYVMNAHGKNLRNLTNSRASDTDPAWSPDGQKIAFVSTRDLHNNIYVMDTDGKNLRNLTNSRASDGEPAWFDPRFTSTVGPEGKLRSTWGRIKTRSYTLSR